MLACPNCKSRLTRTVSSRGVMYLCGKCGGRAVGVAALKRQADPAFMKMLRLAAYGSQQQRGRRCPHCDRPMTEVRPGAGARGITLDVCTRCHCVWFDPTEFARVAEPVEQRPRPAAREAADHGVSAAGAPEYEDAEALWKYLPGILGWPVELTAVPVVRRPLITWGVSAITAALCLVLMVEGNLSAAIHDWGFIPAQGARHGGLTLLTSFFLHAGPFHLLANLYFFLIFGDNVEDHLGRGRFVLLLAGSHLAGMALHGALTVRPGVPCVGASAGISGVIAYYALVFPHARIGLFFWLFLRWLRMRAIWAFVLFVAVQLFGAWRQIGGFSSVSHLGHLGGLGVGIVAAAIIRMRNANVPAAR